MVLSKSTASWALARMTSPPLFPAGTAELPLVAGLLLATPLPGALLALVAAAGALLVLLTLLLGVLVLSVPQAARKALTPTPPRPSAPKRRAFRRVIWWAAMAAARAADVSLSSMFIRMLSLEKVPWRSVCAVYCMQSPG